MNLLQFNLQSQQTNLSGRLGGSKKCIGENNKNNAATMRFWREKKLPGKSSVSAFTSLQVSVSLINIRRSGRQRRTPNDAVAIPRRQGAFHRETPPPFPLNFHTVTVRDTSLPPSCGCAPSGAIQAFTGWNPKVLSGIFLEQESVWVYTTMYAFLLDSLAFSPYSSTFNYIH